MVEPRRGAKQLRPQALRLARLRLWLLLEGAHHDRLLRNVPVYRDLSKRAQAFGLIVNY